MDDRLEQPFPRPLSGRLIPTAPNCLVPSRSPLLGPYVQCEPLNPTIHAAQLYQAGHGSDEALRIWEYLSFGPWPDEVILLARIPAPGTDSGQSRMPPRWYQSKRGEGLARSS